MTTTTRMTAAVLTAALTVGAVVLPDDADAAAATLVTAARTDGMALNPGQPGAGGPDDEGVPPSQGALQEVDVAHVDDLALGGQTGVTIAVTGTGAEHVVTSWKISATHEPSHLTTSPPIEGHDVRVHALTPTLDPWIVVTAARRDDGNLWLTSWEATSDGGLEQLDTRGYGANAGVGVLEYDLTSRAVRRDGLVHHYELATPVVVKAPQHTGRRAGGGSAGASSSGRSVRLVTWSVDRHTGAIAGLDDSEGFGDPGDSANPTVAAIGPASYQVGYRNDDDELTTHTLLVSNGHPALRGTGSSGLDLNGQSPVEVALDDGAVGPLNDDGFVTAVRTSDDDLRMVVWENRVTACDGPCYVTPHLVFDDSGDTKPGQLGTGLPSTSVPTATTGLYDTSAGDSVTSAGMLQEKVPSGPPAYGLGSMTKVMVLLLALEAVDDGLVELDDLVTVPATEAKQWVVEGDQVSLRTLLHGMMKRSSNGSAIAIGYHLAEHAHGVDDVYDMDLEDGKDAVGEIMSQRPAELDLGDTLYCQPQGAGFSTPRDQIDLWMYAAQHPMFRTFAGVGTYENLDPAFDGDGKPISLTPLSKGDWGRLDIDGHKDGVVSGNGGMGYVWEGGQQVLSCDAFDQSTPERACGFCRIVQATRLGRTLIVDSQGGATKPQSDSTLLGLLDWGFARIFTPDHTGSLDAEEVVDFGISHITDTVTVTGTVLAATGELEVCTREAVVWVSDAISTIACDRLTVEGLAHGTGPVATTGTEIERIGTLEAEGDYLTGHLVDGHLRLSTWRVGRRT